MTKRALSDGAGCLRPAGLMLAVLAAVLLPSCERRLPITPQGFAHWAMQQADVEQRWDRLTAHRKNLRESRFSK